MCLLALEIRCFLGSDGSPPPLAALASQTPAGQDGRPPARPPCPAIQISPKQFEVETRESSSAYLAGVRVRWVRGSATDKI